MTPDEVAALLPEVPGWSAAETNGVQRLRRTFTFPDFRDAMGFAVRVGLLAEAEQHHPDLHVEWGKVTMETWTHKIQGLHRNDFILAAKTSKLFGA
jgi:4a-hydroxytetrahydrobiopterin dehydratase